ncbi:YhdB family protein [Bacillus carboniphilus]|uniref:YhdB family protein n=1 Tax=Bacillus carboniphilus TaxID=86663 RepID=A0ABY9JW91_9BACI|nr:YhdB family protein [Bacillus carboniphilus]WLR42752.1 YhdB family protein [Bacillus carboniphilus]
MKSTDYDRALYYTHRSQWENLLILMVRTDDDLLAKRIEHFLHAYNFDSNYTNVEGKLNGLLQYVDNALNVLELKLNEESDDYVYIT